MSLKDGNVTVTFSAEFAEALIRYKAHKAVCTMPYDPYRTPRQCPECGRLNEAVAIQMVIDDKKEVKHE